MISKAFIFIFALQLLISYSDCCEEKKVCCYYLYNFNFIPVNPMNTIIYIIYIYIYYCLEFLLMEGANHTSCVSIWHNARAIQDAMEPHPRQCESSFLFQPGLVP